MSLRHRLGRVPQGLANVLLVKIRMLVEYLLERHPLRDHGQHRRHREPQIPDAGNPAHSVRIGGDSVERHARKLQLPHYR
jgi:hypothetical protein